MAKIVSNKVVKKFIKNTKNFFRKSIKRNFYKNQQNTINVKNYKGGNIENNILNNNIELSNIQNNILSKYQDNLIIENFTLNVNDTSSIFTNFENNDYLNNDLDNDNTNLDWWLLDGHDKILEDLINKNKTIYNVNYKDFFNIYKIISKYEFFFYELQILMKPINNDEKTIDEIQNIIKNIKQHKINLQNYLSKNIFNDTTGVELIIDLIVSKIKNKNEIDEIILLPNEFYNLIQNLNYIQDIEDLVSKFDIKLIIQEQNLEIRPLILEFD